MPSREHTVKIGYVLRKFPVLSETFILNEILALESKGIRVHIFSLAPTRDSRFHENLPLLKCAVSYVPGLSDLGTLLRYNIRAAKRYRGKYFRVLLHVLAKGRPSLFWRFLQSGYIAERAARLPVGRLHAHFAKRTTNVASLASMMSGIPYSFTAHAVDIYRRSVKKRVLKHKIENADFVVTISETNRRYLSEIAIGCANKIFVVYNGIDLSHFAPNGARTKDPFTIICVARLVEKKGLSVLVEACRYLVDRNVEFQCWIVGKGALRPHLKQLIQRWNLGDTVHLLGPHSQSEVLARYHDAHLFVLPCIVGSDGDRDGLPVSIVEALATGLPVVTTPVTGIPEVVRDRQNGLLVPERDPQALADAIESVIGDPRQYEHLQANARASISSTFDLRQTAAALQRLFEGGPS